MSNLGPRAIQVFDQHAELPKIQGTKTWDELSGVEQDEYLLSCFKGEAQRSMVEKRLSLFNRTAWTILHALTDSEEFNPDGPNHGLLIRELRMARLHGTPLGARLLSAVVRENLAKSKGYSVDQFDYSGDQNLTFRSIWLDKKYAQEMGGGGLVLDESCTERAIRDKVDSSSLDTSNPSNAERVTSVPAGKGIASTILQRFSRPSRYKSTVSAAELIFEQTGGGAHLMPFVKLLAKNKEMMAFLFDDEGYNPKSAAYRMIYETAPDLLLSGRFHVYRGMLGLKGMGIMKAWEQAGDALLQEGFIPPEVYELNNRTVRDGIEGAG